MRNLGDHADTLRDLEADAAAVSILHKMAHVSIVELEIFNQTVVLVGLLANSVEQHGRVLVIIQVLALEPHRYDAITGEGCVLVPGYKVAIAHGVMSKSLVICGISVHAQLSLANGDLGTEWSVSVETEVVGTSCLAEALPGSDRKGESSAGAMGTTNINGVTVWSRRQRLCADIGICMTTVAFDVKPSIKLGSLDKVLEALLLELVDKDVLWKYIAQLVVFDSAN